MKQASYRPQRKPLIYLHVGEPKTGSTYLQQVMWRNRAALSEVGVMLPGARPRAHWRATQDLRQVPQLPNDPMGSYAGAWDRISQAALRAPRTAVISHELLAAVTEEQARRALASFGDAEVHVVLGVRDFASLLPAEWQESVKHRSHRPWRDWLGDVIDRESVTENRRQWWFWRVHDTLEVLRIWSEGLPKENVHVLTVPRPGTSPGLLWQRFAGIIGVDHEAVDVTLASANASLGPSQAELLRRINMALPPELPDWFYMAMVKDLIANKTLALEPGKERIELPEERIPWAKEQSDRLIEGLQQSGFDIVGDLSDLEPRRSELVRGPDAVRDEEMLAPAMTSIMALLTQLAADRGIRTSPLDEDADPPPRAWAAIKRFGIRLSRRSATMHRLRRRYWNAANHLRRRRAGRPDDVLRR